MWKALFSKSLIHLFLIILISLFAYSNTFHVPFQFDDREVIVENPIIKDFRYFTEPSKAEGFETHLYNTFKSRYIGFLTFALNYKLHGLDVTGYHTFNLLIHIINALLVYWLVVLTFRTPFLRNQNTESRTHLIAFFSSLLFACHPIQTQAVTYIWQRVTSLATLFYLLSLVMYIKWRLAHISQFTVHSVQTQNTKRSSFLHAIRYTLYAISLISAILAMKTKEIAFTLPVVITLYEFMFFKEKLKRRILYLIPLLFTMLIIPLTLIGIDKPFGDMLNDVGEASRVQTEMSRLTYLFTQFRVIVTYIRLLFLPINQNLDYDYPIYDSFLDPNVYLSFLFLLTILILGIYLLYRSRISHPEPKAKGLRDSSAMPQNNIKSTARLIAFGIFWFFITLSVESSFIPIVDVIFEHRVYLPSVGAIIAFSTAIVYVASQLIAKSANRKLSLRGALATKQSNSLASERLLCLRLAMTDWTRATVYSLLPAIVIALSIATYQRNSIWEDEVRLWEDVVRKSPNKARAYDNLAAAHIKAGRNQEAIEYLIKALNIDPLYPEAYNDLGLVFINLREYDKAIEFLKKAIRIKIDFISAYTNIGIAYSRLGNHEEAIKAFKLALEIDPKYFYAIINLGDEYMLAGYHDKALYLYTQALEIKPDNATIYYRLGLLHEKLNKYKEAREFYNQALKIRPDYLEARKKLESFIK